MSFDLVKLLLLASLACIQCSFKVTADARSAEGRSFKPLSETYQPVDVGFQFATPLGLSNTLQNSVAGPVSIALIVAFAGILVAGLVTSKFNQQEAFSSRSNEDTGLIFRLTRLLENLEADDAFRFMGDQKDGCKRKVICHIHQSLAKAPDWVQMIFRFFSRNVRGVSKYKEDILKGFAGGCREKYQTECQLSIGQIFMKTPLVSHFLRQQNQHFKTVNEHTFRFM